ncbi:MAG: CvpA family protein [Candidatus Omnitrophica bacterium]|nr:CvpA family protein [Candidatus Omnitrophota bacterium]
MGLEFIKKLNWIDLFVIILLIRITYIATKTGSFLELFKLLGIVLANYLSLHYYTILADKLKLFLKTKIIPVEILDFLSFFLLLIFGYFIFYILREIFLRLIKIEVVSALNRWIALFMGVVRGLIFISLIMYLFSIPVVNYFKVSIEDSYWGSRIRKFSPSLYELIWSNFMSKFMPQEKLNPEVLKIYQS